MSNKTCANCGKELPPMNFWESIVAITEYVLMFPNDPLMKKAVNVICDECYNDFKVWMEDLIEEDREFIEKQEIESLKKKIFNLMDLSD